MERIWRRFGRRIPGFLVVLALLSACGAPPLSDVEQGEEAGVTTDPAQARLPQYAIGPGDEIQIDVWRNPDLSVTVPVRPDGYISMPLVGDVRVVGFTPEQVAAKIESDLRQYIRTPKVAVIMTNLVSSEFRNRVRITGAVNTPGSISYQPGLTVLDVVLNSGGLTDFASGEAARLYRKTADGRTVTYPVYLNSIINRGDLETNYVIEPGDVITVPERRF